METRLPWRPTRGSLTSPSYLVRNRTLGPPLENNPEIPPSSREEGLRLLQDRKSTRLNSSHQKISYAVFCLKKKNQGEGARVLQQVGRPESKLLGETGGG